MSGRYIRYSIYEGSLAETNMEKENTYGSHDIENRSQPMV